MLIDGWQPQTYLSATLGSGLISTTPPGPVTSLPLLPFDFDFPVSSVNVSESDVAVEHPEPIFGRRNGPKVYHQRRFGFINKRTMNNLVRVASEQNSSRVPPPYWYWPWRVAVCQFKDARWCCCGRVRGVRSV